MMAGENRTLGIQRLPRGLVDLLGMQTTGDTPHYLADSIAGEIDFLDLFLADRMQVASFTTGVAIPGIGTANCGTSSGPSAGFIRFLYAASYETGAVAAAASIQTHLGIARGSSVTNVVLLPNAGTGLLAAAGVASVGLSFGKPLLMFPGDILAFRTSVYTGAPAITPGGFIYFADVRI